MLIDTGRQGILGESAFQYRGAALVLRLSKPISEKGPYDYIIDSGRRFWRVNVKSSRCMTRWLMYNVWVGRNRNRGRHGQQAVPYLKSEIDFIAIYIIPEDTFCIIPVSELAGRTHITSYSSQHPKPGPYAKKQRSLGPTAGVRGK